MDEHKDYFKKKDLENPVPYCVATDGLKASIKSETNSSKIEEDDLIEIFLNDIDDCV